MKDLPGAIQQAISQARGLPLKLINDAATALAAKAKTVLRGKGGNPGSDGWVSAPAEQKVTIAAGPHTVKLRVVVNANKQPVLMRSVDGDLEPRSTWPRTYRPAAFIQRHAQGASGNLREADYRRHRGD